ncbi:hypothetical protein V7S43_017963 [Phytophthora oleae]|uniref:FYVE-type domain-containing protein n=1 Tax=Phytophthora oleae TaxID=2107226 RepID=A0ABD3EVX5_9STRA
MDVNYPPKPFTLPPAAAKALEQLADQFVAETLSESDEFIYQSRVVDKVQWKTLKTKDSVTAFRSRVCAPSSKSRSRIDSEDADALAQSPEMPEFYPITEKNIQSALSASYLGVSATCPEAHDREGTVYQEPKTMDKSRPKNSPMVFCTGFSPGTVEDAALGFLAETEARTQLRTLMCTEAQVDRVQILARIQGPSFEDPFRFLGVKWMALSIPGAAKRYLKPRDYLLLESSGMALDSDGERFCYLLSHSIVLDQVPEFGCFERQTFSACHIVRPSKGEGEVEIFSRGFKMATKSLVERLSMNQYCDVLLAVPLMIEEAYTRKLIWLLRTEARGVRSLRMALVPTEPGQALEACLSCNDKLNSGIGKLFGYSICVLCRQCACRKCTVKRFLPREAGNSKKKIALKFCLKCYLEAKNLSAWQVGINSLSVTGQELMQ